jgi:putative ATP-dependent endonuclease of OLD family
MYLSKLKLWNFRKYSTGKNGTPGLEINFHEGLNVLIGENDSGKTAIVDAIRCKNMIKDILQQQNNINLLDGL